MKKVYTSLYITKELKSKIKQCVQELDIEEIDLLSVLCFKAGKFLCSEAQCFQTVDYQERGKDYEIMPVYFYAADHEYIHSNRLSCKVSVSKLLSFAMVLFLDEIMQKGINQMEIAQLRIIENSYKKKSFKIRNFSGKITKNDQFEEYIMKMMMKKT